LLKFKKLKTKIYKIENILLFKAKIASNHYKLTAMQKRYPRFICLTLLSTTLLGMSVSPLSAQTSSPKSPYTDITVTATGTKTYRDLQIEADAEAAKYIKQAFGRNVSQAFVRVLGDRNGLISPMLTISVSNAQWRSQPKIQAWAKYYPNSNVLLGFVAPSPTTITPSTAPTATTKSTSPANIAPPAIPASTSESPDLPGFRDD